VHSGGVEEAVNDGRIRDVTSLEGYLVGRLATSGRVDAALAASCWDIATCTDAETSVGFGPAPSSTAALESGPSDVEIGRRWAVADAEAAARCPVPALRTAARSQGRGLLRAAAKMWPSPVSLTTVAGVHPEGPMWPVAVGAVSANAGVGRHGAAIVAAQASVSGAAWAAVRLLGLDPFSVAALLADLTAAVDAVASEATERLVSGEAASPNTASVVFAGTETESRLQIQSLLAALPAAGGPLTDIAAVTHTQREVRLFAS
jgi:urease accessory protein